MNFLKKSLLSAAAVAAMGVASTSQAGVVIDLFDLPSSGSQSVSTDVENDIQNNQNALAYPTTSVIGGYRDLSIKKLDTGADGAGAVVSLRVAGGQLRYGNDPGAQSIGVVTWDGANLAGNLGGSAQYNGFGPAGVDLTMGGTIDQIFADVISADLGFNYKITVWDMDGDKSVLSAGVQFQVNSTISSHYLLSWFNLATGTYCDGGPAPCADPFTQLDFSIVRSGLPTSDGVIDFTKVGALQLTLEGARADVDLRLGSIQTVPEPGALALTGLALLGAGAASRRRSSKK